MSLSPNDVINLDEELVVDHDEINQKNHELISALAEGGKLELIHECESCEAMLDLPLMIFVPSNEDVIRHSYIVCDNCVD